MSTWWTDEKINSGVTREYVTSKLPLDKQSALHRPLAFGDGLTDDTYLDWILDRGKRLFLIFQDLGIPEWIFEAVDRSFDDGDLPLPEEAIAELNLSHGKASSLDKAFFRRQFKYLIQEIQDGSHVDYEADEIVPVEPQGKRPGILTSRNIDKVHVSRELHTRRKIAIGGEDGVDKVHFVLHARALQRLKHPHLISVFASYTQGTYGYVLSTPSLDLTLKSFLDEPPKAFKSLSKPEKRVLLLRWMHCLSDALAYLHEQGYAHQAIRPSNIFIDPHSRIYLGESAALDALEDATASYDREVYEYAAPEQWQRKPVLQDLEPAKIAQHGGGRTARRLPKNNPGLVTPGLISPGLSNRSSVTTSSSSASNTRSLNSKIAPSPHHSGSTVRPQSATTSSSGSITSTLTKRALVTTFAPVSLPSLFPPDIFSLSTIHIHLLCALFSLASSSHTSSRFSPKSLRSHLSKHNRTAGRGGAPADSSFHANLKQVDSWLEKVGKEARGRAKGDEQQGVWQAVGALTEVVRKGVQRDGNERWKARDEERRIREIVGWWCEFCGDGRVGLVSHVAEDNDGFLEEEEPQDNEEDDKIVIMENMGHENRSVVKPDDWILPELSPSSTATSPLILQGQTLHADYAFADQIPASRASNWPLSSGDLLADFLKR